ncbi:hypothetical protein GYMLUDRAFT_200755 [Collybiopsis luxurians FD-317 M1]|uniref:Peptide hydrolase n=1 Tax=Collybiopsis luxurians FD-317 M1 TaxID=944289 RepID=A0A0D0BWV5_9AGAR|nr:hypothetical protein GYMLUDRAFT_200755 [Collybiopsis luxurians FD-317 M1]
MISSQSRLYLRLLIAQTLILPVLQVVSATQPSFLDISPSTFDPEAAQSPFAGAWSENDNGLGEFDFDALRLVRFFGDTLSASASTSELFKGLEEPVWITESEKLNAKRMGKGYIDITEHPEYLSFSSTPFQRQHKEHIYRPPNSTIVPKILPLLSLEEQKSNLKVFTSFHTRFYNSDTGHASSRWLYQRVVNYTENYASDVLRDSVNIEVKLWKHAELKQESVVIRLIPKVSENGPITIIGAHCDSINNEHPFFRSPGADDDGSGTITVLEAYRGILQSGYVPSSPLEFHFYAAEEGGLLGSLDISDAYAKQGKDVRGMIEFDMTAWVEAGTSPEIGVIMNLADLPLSEYLKLLIEKYIDTPWVETRYPGHAGSDYMSWSYAGYQSCHAVESRWDRMNNRNHHRETDSFDVSPEFSFDHILRFTKLAVAFAVELSEY